jgi:hypothetical protein
LFQKLKKELLMSSVRSLYLIFCFSVLLVTASLSQAQTFNVEDLGDDELSCQALYDGIKEMDAHIQSASQTQNQNQAQRSAGNSTGGLFGDLARESGSSEGARVANLFGRLIAGAGGAAAANEAKVDPAVLRSQAQARKQHLTSLFRSKKCKVSTLRK